MENLNFISITLIIKITFLVILMMLTVYLFYMESKIMEAKDKNLKSDFSQNNNFLKSSGSIRKPIKELFLVYLPAFGSFYSFYLAKKNTELINLEKNLIIF